MQILIFSWCQDSCPGDNSPTRQLPCQQLTNKTTVQVDNQPIVIGAPVSQLLMQEDCHWSGGELGDLPNCQELLKVDDGDHNWVILKNRYIAIYRGIKEENFVKLQSQAQDQELTLLLLGTISRITIARITITRMTRMTITLT